MNFRYKQYDPLPPSQRVSLDVGEKGSTHYQSSVEWVSVNVASNEEYADISINSLANDLKAGDNYAKVKFLYIREQSPHQKLDGIRNTISTMFELEVYLYLEHTPRLYLSPSELLFEYIVFSKDYLNKTVTVESESRWVVTEATPWLAVSKNSGYNNGTFDVTIDPTGLNNGKHTADITVKDALNTRILTVVLLISEPSAANSLYVNPKNIAFGYTLSGIIPPKKRIEVNASKKYQVEASKSWIDWTVNYGKDGIGYLEIGLKNSVSALDLGHHNGLVVLTLGAIIQSISVNLMVYSFAKELLDKQKLYYTDEDNYIKVSSGRYDTHLNIIVNSYFEGVSYTIPYKIPFYKGAAKKRIGAAAKKMISSRPLIGVSSAFLYIPYRPVKLDLRIQEEETFSDNTVQEIDLDSIQFIKGYKPKSNWLSDMPKKVYLTSKGIVLFSFLNNQKIANTIEITGAITKSHPFSVGFNEFYTAILSLSYENLKIGDIINVSSNGVGIEVQIKPTGIDHSFIFWENQWGCWDCFECTGAFAESSSIKQTAFRFRKNEHQKQTKVLEVTDRRVYTINTGWVYTDEEVITLQKMLTSKNIYLMKDGKTTQVRSITKGLVIVKTNRFLKSFDLKFENVLI